MFFFFLIGSQVEPMEVIRNFTFIYIIAMWNGKLAYARKLRLISDKHLEEREGSLHSCSAEGCGGVWGDTSLLGSQLMKIPVNWMELSVSLFLWGHLPGDCKQNLDALHSKRRCWIQVWGKCGKRYFVFLQGDNYRLNKCFVVWVVM